MCSPANLRPTFSLPIVRKTNHECVDLKRKMHRKIRSTQIQFYLGKVGEI